MISKRGFFLGGLSVLAAPAIVRASSLMPISVITDSQININILKHKAFMLPTERVFYCPYVPLQFCTDK